MEESIEQTQSSEKTSLLSPEGILMMTIGITLDALSVICAVLILAFGIGLILSKIVYAFGFIIVFAWSMFRGGGIQQGKGGINKQASKGLDSFLKKYKKNLITKAIPAIGDVLPIWTLTIYTELKS